MPTGYEAIRKDMSCSLCGAKFFRAALNQKYCSIQCRRNAGKEADSATTAGQYQRISGNWGKYYNRLRTIRGRSDISLAELLALHEAQGGRCALSGVPLTCTLERGVKCPTNSSIDRIDPKGPYTRDNIQLVCAVINKFRVDTSIQDFISWCRKVANYAVCE